MSAWLHNRSKFEIGLLAFAAVWLLCVVAWRVVVPFPDVVGWIVFGATLPLGCFWLWSTRQERVPTTSENGRLIKLWLVASIVYVVWWQLTTFALDSIGLFAARAWCANIGRAGLFMIGLVWLIYVLEVGTKHFDVLRRNRNLYDGGGWSQWNPLDLHAWFYRENYSLLDFRFWFSLVFARRTRREIKDAPGPKGTSQTEQPDLSRKLDQSVLGLLSYVVLFALVVMTFGQLRGCREIYELPAGGGQQKTLAQVVRVQKVVRKKFIVNPNSSIMFEVPPIDEVKLELMEATEHAYTVGYGEGVGAGFAGGTTKGKVRFIRLEYNGGDWDQDFGIGGDFNMLLEYGLRTQHKVVEKTESRLISQLRSFPIGKSPPLVYMTGQKNISISASDEKTLREYIVDKHGMIFCDNGGSRHFHNQFLAVMNRVLPNVRPVPIPLDDVIHRVPYQIPYLPYVAPHGGKEALGWYQDGRWLAYYHPGDIGDAWADGHAGVSAEITEGCYRLGTNIIFYAHAEYAKWKQAQEKGK